MATDDQKWYFNSETKEVSQGKKSSWLNRMGPYDSKEEAELALGKNLLVAYTTWEGYNYEDENGAFSRAAQRSIVSPGATTFTFARVIASVTSL